MTITMIKAYPHAILLKMVNFIRRRILFLQYRPYAALS
jgi:hypothetical protein